MDHNDPMADGAHLAAKEAGREKDINFLLGIDGLPDEGRRMGQQRSAHGDIPLRNAWRGRTAPSDQAAQSREARACRHAADDTDRQGESAGDSEGESKDPRDVRRPALPSSEAISKRSERTDGIPPCLLRVHRGQSAPKRDDPRCRLLVSR
jgi:hypothetical protein